MASTEEKALDAIETALYRAVPFIFTARLASSFVHALDDCPARTGDREQHRDKRTGGDLEPPFRSGQFGLETADPAVALVDSDQGRNGSLETVEAGVGQLDPLPATCV